MVLSPSIVEQVHNQALLGQTGISPAANTPTGFNISTTLIKKKIKKKKEEFPKGKYYLNQTSSIKYQFCQRILKMYFGISLPFGLENIKKNPQMQNNRVENLFSRDL